MAASLKGPVAAKGLTATSWSLWGPQRAFAYAEEVARTLGQATACRSVACLDRPCRHDCAIMNVAYGRQFLWTRCTVTFDVHCEARDRG